MGWEYAWNTRKELIAHLCNEPTNYKTLARKVTSEDGESVLWAVHEIGPDDKENPGFRFIMCYLMRYDRKHRLHGCKEIGETMGPSYYSCPLSFLEMVPKPEGEYVKEWRENVRRFHADMAENARRFKTLKIGDTVTVHLEKTGKTDEARYLREEREPIHPRVVEHIRQRAYQLYEQRGRTDGFDLDDWFRAEAEVLGSRK
ncbi:MAG: DUF2934 domain-containing protein [Candidatus Sulfotelmatobacter sp.]